MVSVSGAFLKKRRELFWCIKKGVFMDPEDFAGWRIPLCWHIPLNPRNLLYLASQRVCSRNNEVVEHVVSYLLPAYIQNLYRHSIQNRHN